MSQDPRTAILTAAGEVFARFGFKKASVEDIARRAGVGKGSIYLHFESKEALFEACVQMAHAGSLSELKARVRRASTSEGQVRAYIQCKLEQQSRKPLGERIELSTLLELGVQAAQFIPRMVEDDVAVLAHILEEGVAQGTFSVPEPQHVARGLVTLIMQLAVKLMPEEQEPALKQSVDSFFEVFIRGLLAPPRPSS
ncbi:TetR/AcrR family transcriptional regulator [Corallococcus carmarthensis]|uniref:TetR/AcrR family transcriptional regulator n=1 Tax=Corallococcus carmarthensis TaxID=2316728 RepID=A0A3A8KL34_9BACT|nr:TetR/AcrR family transcriptional regulator [Corallococcus carmarthensis]NOK16704.1 TetR/AcrR family transcriptional regulator [Corallococcus carmarthensis]RKH07849.1 TetR/AcrR family transcriptional regulator [Corallococcus carmarthensis]